MPVDTLDLSGEARQAEGGMTMRILHVLGGMNVGGIETWLMHVLRNIDRTRYHLDFLVHTTEPGAYDEEIRRLGSQVIPCLSPSQPLAYARNLRRILREHGPYDVVHSHVHHFSGFVLRCARQAGVPMRIAHSHNDTTAVERRAGVLRRGYVRLMRRWIWLHATHGIGCSDQAAIDLFGPAWRQDSRNQILYYGLDLSAFAAPVGRDAARAAVGLPIEAFVVGHIGRMLPQKNHLFLVEVFNAVVQRRPDAHLLLVGDGSGRAAIEQAAERMGLRDRVHLVGIRMDVARCLEAMDVFVFPSIHEGLGLVLIEAQAAGLPCLASLAVPEEVMVCPGQVKRLELASGAEAWAEQLVTIPPGPPTSVGLETIQRSQFNITQSVTNLCTMYGHSE